LHPSGINKRKILFVVTEDWAFSSHRIPTANAARDAGFDVVVSAREGSHRHAIEEMGFRFIPWRVKRKSLNPFYELRAIFNLIKIFYTERPTVAYNVTLKPIIYGSIAARFAGTPHTINLFAGLGAWFILKRLSLRLIRAAVMPLLKYIHAEPGTWLMVQNSDDKNDLAKLGIGNPERTVLVPGSGIDANSFTLMPEPDGPLTAVFLSRMLWDKGVGETVEAARLLKAKGRNIRIVLVGDPDTENPGHVPDQMLKTWDDEGVIEWWGRKKNVQAVWAKAHVALLPSYYREGIPRSLLEGAACSRPMIGADAPGCRDLVRDGKNGILVPPRDAKAIAEALIRLDEDFELRQRLGKEARKDVEENYSTDAVGGQIKALLEDLVDKT
jgi:glycosyltransferase involved in cell wall biosynthesis